MIRCLLVDDEPLARDLLAGYIFQDPGLSLIKTCAYAGEAMEEIVSGNVDLLFLDIRMPRIGGIEFLQSLKSPPAVIFTTAYSEFAAKSYELNAIDYLLKPITYERFSVAVKKYQKQLFPVQKAPTSSFFKVNGELLRLIHANIIYIEAVRDYVLIKTTGKTFITHITMKGLGQLLPEGFRRIHRSYFVNRAFVTRIGTEDLDAAGVKLPISQTYKLGITEWFNQMR